MQATIPANWVSVCGYDVEYKDSYNKNGELIQRKQSKNLGCSPKIFKKESAQKLIQAYREKGLDLKQTPILTGKNAQNNTNLETFVTKLAEYSEKNGHLTVEDFTKAGGELSGLTPSKNNKVFTRIVATLMKNGCFIEKTRGAKGEVVENVVDLDELDLF